MKKKKKKKKNAECWKDNRTGVITAAKQYDKSSTTVIFQNCSACTTEKQRGNNNVWYAISYLRNNEIIKQILQYEFSKEICNLLLHILSASSSGRDQHLIAVDSKKIKQWKYRKYLSIFISSNLNLFQLMLS